MLNLYSAIFYLLEATKPDTSVLQEFTDVIYALIPLILAKVFIFSNLIWKRALRMCIVALLRTIKRNTNSIPATFHSPSAIMLKTLKVSPQTALIKTVNKLQVILTDDQRSTVTAKCALNPGAQDEKITCVSSSLINIVIASGRNKITVPGLKAHQYYRRLFCCILCCLIKVAI